MGGFAWLRAVILDRHTHARAHAVRGRGVLCRVAFNASGAVRGGVCSSAAVAVLRSAGQLSSVRRPTSLRRGVWPKDIVLPSVKSPRAPPLSCRNSSSPDDPIVGILGRGKQWFGRGVYTGVIRLNRFAHRMSLRSLGNNLPREV